MGETPAAPASTADLVERMERLNVPVLSDCLDHVGIRNQVLPPRIRPLQPTSRAAGRAMTVLTAPVDDTRDDPVEVYKGIARAIDALKPGDVMVVSTCHRGSYWGELMATASSIKGAVGVVADAYARDTGAIERMGFPTFVAGVSAQDSVGRMDVVDVDVEIGIEGVTIRPGDFVLADQDGVVVVPADAAEEVIARAEAKRATENDLRASLQDGMSITDAVVTYGIL
jgi:regulator of RNase E activity RraA